MRSHPRSKKMGAIRSKQHVFEDGIKNSTKPRTELHRVSWCSQRVCLSIILYFGQRLGKENGPPYVRC